jgi:hypothetical protein
MESDKPEGGVENKQPQGPPSLTLRDRVLVAAILIGIVVLGSALVAGGWNIGKAMTGKRWGMVTGAFVGLELSLLIFMKLVIRQNWIETVVMLVLVGASGFFLAIRG